MILDWYFGLDVSVHLSSPQIKLLYHWNQSDELLIDLTFIFFHQNLPYFFPLSFSFSYLNCSLIQDVLVFALDEVLLQISLKGRSFIRGDLDRWKIQWAVIVKIIRIWSLSERSFCLWLLCLFLNYFLWFL